MIKITDKWDHKVILAFFLLFSLYIGLRALSWSNTILLEDTDSILYLKTIKGFLELNFEKYLSNSSTCPFYPSFGALLSLPGWSVETGARLTSFVFSLILFISLFSLGTHFLRLTDIICGIILFCFSPVLISLSFGVLTEPSYVATIYLGLWFFWKQYDNPTFWKASLLGIIFGLAFLNRVEGILFLAVIPFWEISYYIFLGKKTLRFKQVVQWSLTYILFFALIVSPQIYKVSKQLGSLSLNGRQVWSAVLNKADGKSKTEKLFGLDYSPKELNIKYLSKNPGTLNQLKSNTNIFQNIKTVVREFNELYQKRLGELIGPLGLIFFAFGLTTLYQETRLFEIFLLLTFIGFNLVGPLLHNVAIRHIISIAPIIFLVSGVGIGYIANVFSGAVEKSMLNMWLTPIIILCITITAWAIPLRETFRPANHNREYSPIELAEPVSIVNKISQTDLGRLPNIASERAYLAYFSIGNQFYLPFTDYEGFVRYCELNNVDFFYLNHWRVKSKKYPFYKNFSENSAPDFIPLYNGKDFKGNKTTLFRFNIKYPSNKK